MKRRLAADTKQIAIKRICSGCVGERFLKAIIDAEGIEASCSFCDDISKTFTIEQLADHIEQAFDGHYERTPTEPDVFEAAMQLDREIGYDWQRHGNKVLWAIADAADIDKAAASEALSVLRARHYDLESARMGDECPFAKDSYYTEKDSGCEVFRLKWSEFENGVKTEARFFSHSAKATLDEIFAGLPNLKTNKGSPVLVNAGPDEEIKFLHRARVFAAEDDKLKEALKNPWKHLGPPPMHAAMAGRMSARGIVAPSSGSRISRCQATQLKCRSEKRYCASHHSCELQFGHVFR